MRKSTIIFIQGGGEGAYEMDRKLVSYLLDALGEIYDIHYPKMPKENDPDFELWKAKIDKELEKIDGQLILMGHSIGRFLLLRYLSERKIQKDIAGMFFIATPFLGDKGWQFQGITLDKDLASKLPPNTPIFFYHSTNDEIVPFAHLALYADKLPHATIRKIEGRGHQFNYDLREVVEDLKNLTK